MTRNAIDFEIHGLALVIVDVIHTINGTPEKVAEAFEVRRSGRRIARFSTLAGAADYAYHC